jgi:transposase, IS6 family
MRAKGFRSFDGAWQAIQGYEVMHIIRKRQVRWLLKGDVAGQILLIHKTLGLKVA